MESNIKYKVNPELVVKDIDEAKNLVKVGINTVNYKDFDGDIIVKNAFSKTISERKEKMYHLMQHDKDQPVGRPKEFGWDGDLLWAVTNVSQSTKGRDLLEDYKVGLYEHSIGFETLKNHYDDSEKANIITELKLWEYSSVTWGANDKTPFIGFVKGLKKENAVEKVNDRMAKVIKAIKSGNYTDERFYMLEYELKQIQDFYNSLITTEPTDGGHSSNDEPDSNLIISLISKI
jgi:HK97 family phage prohead protease